jgi:hypothetical protein
MAGYIRPLIVATAESISIAFKHKIHVNKNIADFIDLALTNGFAYKASYCCNCREHSK